MAFGVEGSKERMSMWVFTMHSLGARAVVVVEWGTC